MPIRPEGSGEADRLSRLAAVGGRLAADTDLLPALRFLLESAVALTGAERGFLFSRRDARVTCEASVPDPALAPGPVPPHVSRSVLQRALEDGEAVLSIDLADDIRFRERRSVRRLGLRSVLAVPLRCRRGWSAVVYLDSRMGRTHFRDDDRQLLLAFAAQASLALETAGLAAPVAAPGDRSPLRVPRIRRAEGGPTVLGSSPAMRRVLDLVARFAPTDLAVLVVGESGTGKELVARAIHAGSPRSAGRFLAENCAALPEALVESELFGAVRGAFTGADRDREGLFRGADGGTLFLDEVGEMPLALQARLLRALQEREIRPVGATKPVPVDVRVVAATNRDPTAAIGSRRLRPDLYYRLAGVTITLPPLRERREDIPLLAARFLESSARERGTRPLRLAPEALLRLAALDWPGNVRELRNEIERAAVLAHGEAIEPEDLSPALCRPGVALAVDPSGSAAGARPREERRRPPAERTMIESALVGAGGNVAEAARRIGWTRQKLYRRMRCLGVPVDYGRQSAAG